MRKRLLMIAFHYPPCHGTSGSQRTLAFTRYLVDHGWDPALLTVRPSAYETTSDSELAKIPSGMTVSRAFALDVARHLAILGRYPSRLAVPDRVGKLAISRNPAGFEDGPTAAAGRHLVHISDRNRAHDRGERGRKDGSAVGGGHAGPHGRVRPLHGHGISGESGGSQVPACTSSRS